VNKFIFRPSLFRRRGFPIITTIAITLIALVPRFSQAELSGGRLMQLYQNNTTQLSNYQQSLSGTQLTNYYKRGEYSLVSSQPIAKWFADWPADLTQVRYEVADYVGAAWGAGQVPVLVIYNLYKRDCTSASDGGPPVGDVPRSNAHEGPAFSLYMQYITQFTLGLQDARANAVTNMPVIILLEPDSLGLQTTATIDGVAQKGDVDGCADYSQQYLTNDPKTPHPPVVFSNATRNAFLARTVQLLAGAACYDGAAECASYDSWVKVYLDGTHSGWGGYPNVADGYLVSALVDAGIKDAAGIFTNVSNYQILGDPNSIDQHNGELAYGKWLLDRVKARMGAKYQGVNVWGFRPSTCGSGFCGVIPEKGQVIDVARIGAGVNLSNSNDQGNGWSGWCDNINARVGPPPTLYPRDITGAWWVDALLWVKPAGETDGCFGNWPTNHNIARGVPFPTIAFERAGTLDLNASCMLIAGIQGVDGQHMPILNDCNYAQNWTGSLRPQGLRIAKTKSVAAGDTYDAVMLEWNPVPGACRYQVYARAGTSGSLHRIYQIDGTYRNGPASAAFIPSWGAMQWFTGSTVQFAVRTMFCVTSAYGPLSSAVTTHDFTL